MKVVPCYKDFVNYPSYQNAYHLLSFGLEFEFEQVILAIESCAHKSNLVHVGAGCGRLLTCKAFSEFERVTLLEPDFKMRAHLLDRTDLAENVEILPNDSFRSGLPSNSVDAIVLSYNSIGEMTPILFSLGEFQRILKPNGVLFFNVHNPLCRKGVAQGLKRFRIPDVPGCYSVDSFPLPSHGPFAFLTELNIAVEDSFRTFHIKQVFPDLETWDVLCKLAGFKIESIWKNTTTENIVDEKESHAHGFLCKKTLSETSIIAHEMVDFYDRLAPAYFEVTEKFAYCLPEWLSEQCKNMENAQISLLDLGCGPGYVASLLKKMNISGRFFGVDFSTEMLNMAEKSGLYLSLLRLDLNVSFPLIEHLALDYITAFGIFEFVSDIGTALTKCRQSLRVGGEVWFSVEKTMPDCPTNGEFDPLTGGRRWHFSQEQITEIMSESGLQIIACDELPAYQALLSRRQVFYFLIRARRMSL
jgi:SAM-dependent methyltransferase